MRMSILLEDKPDTMLIQTEEEFGIIEKALEPLSGYLRMEMVDPFVGQLK